MIELQKHLRQTGRRMTTQRSAVYEALCAWEGHPTAEDLYLTLRGRLPHISLATVYNNLEMLVNAGMAVKLTGERSARYDAICEPHAHAKCTHCGQVQDLPHETDVSLEKLTLPPGFIPSNLAVEIDGVCADCATEEKVG